MSDSETPPHGSDQRNGIGTKTIGSSFRRRTIRWIVIVLAACVIAPFVTSRMLASSRRINMIELTAVDAGVPRDRQVRMLCYNIAHGRGLAESNWRGGSVAERRERLDEIAELLDQSNADIVVLNEVDFDCSWSDQVDQARYLAARSGYRYICEQRNVDVRLLNWTWRFGNAVLSKFPLDTSREIDYPAYSEFESLLAGKKRGVACGVEYGAHDFTIAAVHLSHRDESIRNQSAAMLAELASDGQPVVLAGDFNSTPSRFPEHVAEQDGGNAIETIDETGRFVRSPWDLPKIHELTFPAETPARVIDWIMIPANWRFQEYQALAEQLSDHRPVMADVFLNQDP